MKGGCKAKSRYGSLFPPVTPPGRLSSPQDWASLRIYFSAPRFLLPPVFVFLASKNFSQTLDQKWTAFVQQNLRFLRHKSN